MTYVTLNTLIFATKKLSGGRLVPSDEDHKDYWTYKPGGNPPWFIRLIKDPQTVVRREPREESIHSQVTEEPIKGAGGDFSGASHSQWAHDKEFGAPRVEESQLSEMASSRTLNLSKQSSRT
jgi:adenine/guanine/hypoxanthine permease